jgi:citronellol/citronellal dehydrogenase
VSVTARGGDAHRAPSPDAARVPSPGAEACRVLAPGALAGRRALVTGAGTGIGRAIAVRLAELGAIVVGVGRRPDPLAGTARLIAAAGALRRPASAAGGGFVARTVDVRDPAAVAAVIGELRGDGLDLLVNNAGGQFVAPARAISDRGMAAVLDLNLTAVARLIDSAGPLLQAAGGTVVTISLSATERGIPGLSHSAAARAAIAALTAQRAEEWASLGVDLYALAPGTVLTDGVREELTPEALARTLKATPLGRDTTLAEVAEWVAAMAAGVTGLASGSHVELDGGAGLRGAAGLVA